MSYFRERVKPFYPPAEMTVGGNIRYAIDGKLWIPLYPGETIYDVFDYDRDEDKVLEDAPKLTIFPFTSESGSKYELRILGSDVSCSCPGYFYRKSCRHSKSFKELMKL